MGRFLLFGFKNSSGQYLWAKIQWKELPANFLNGNDQILSDRKNIFTGGTPTQDKAHIIINTQNFGCTTTPNISNTATPGTAFTKKENHFFYSGFANNTTTTISMKYNDCAGTNANSPGQLRSVGIVKTASAVAPVTLLSATDRGCVNGKRKIEIALQGGTGVYEMNQPGEVTFINGVQYDKYVLLDTIFGRNYLLLDPGTTSIKVRDARVYDQLTGVNDPVNGQDAMFTLLPQISNLGAAGYYTIPITSVASCTTPATTCYRLYVANYASSGDYRPITLNSSGNVLNLNSAGDNTNNSIWKVERVDGTYSKIVSATNNNIAITIENGTAGQDNIVNVATYTGAGSQKWLINQDPYNNNFLRSSLNNAFFVGGGNGAYGGGDTDPNTKDLKLKSDTYWGANKWVMQAVGCPVATCYRLYVANYASSGDYRPITLNSSGNVLNLNSAGDNTNNSIWKVEPVDGTYSKIVSATNNNIAITIENGTAGQDNIVNVATYTGAGSQKWLINQDPYNNNFLRSSLNNSFFVGGGNGAYGGGDTDPNTKDLKLKSDTYWGANKWVMQTVGCPAPASVRVPVNSSFTDIQAVKQETGVFISPNPVNKELNFAYTSHNQNSFVRVAVYDVFGKNHVSVLQPKKGSTLNGTISVYGLVPGNYTLMITEGEKVTSKKFIKQ
ncbi:MAG: T9SS type A sorting domain-containing protein [Dinghuibacter sp.]|nr:T9SS type A sorting domain-containing protein [Dinghuibacter sp.]